MSMAFLSASNPGGNQGGVSRGRGGSFNFNSRGPGFSQSEKSHHIFPACSLKLANISQYPFAYLQVCKKKRHDALKCRQQSEYIYQVTTFPRPNCIAYIRSYIFQQHRKLSQIQKKKNSVFRNVLANRMNRWVAEFNVRDLLIHAKKFELFSPEKGKWGAIFFFIGQVYSWTLNLLYDELGNIGKPHKSINHPYPEEGNGNDGRRSKSPEVRRGDLMLRQLVQNGFN